ncbi:hypothetical protein Tco_0832434 [Tanacetum coccineum]
MSKVMLLDQESENESWGESEEDDDDHKSDDKRAKSDYDESIDLNKINDEESDDEFVHTPDDYVPTDNETQDVDDEEYVRINEELYDDVNVEMKDVEPADEGKGDKEMTDAEKVDVEHEEINQEVEIPKSETLSAINLRVSDLENEEVLKQVYHSTSLLATIKSKVPTAAKEYLGTSLGDALHKVLQRHTTEFIKEHFVLADVVEVLKQQQKPHKSAADIRQIKMEHATK